MTTQVAYVEADGVKVFYRYAGSTEADAPTVLLLHGFPSSSHMFRNLMPLLAGYTDGRSKSRYRVVAPDLPGFGFTEVPEARKYEYTFASFARTVGAFTDALAIKRFAVYIFDYGAPTGLRLALERPGAVAAIVTQNGNAYTDGLGQPFWSQLEPLWKADERGAAATAETREALRGALLGMAATRWQYEYGSPHPEKVQPEAYHLDQALMERPGNKDIQLDLFQNYGTNLPLYPRFQEYFRTSGVPVLAVWGKKDEIFISPGAEAYRRDVRDFELHYLDAGHFALETNEQAMATYMHDFFEKYYVFEPR